MVRAHDLCRGADITRGYNFVTEMGEQARQGAPGVLVIFYEQDMQWFGCFARDGAVPPPISRPCWQGAECHLERCAETSATALRFYRSMMKVHETFGNCEPQSESDKLSAHRRISLLEWLKQ